MACTRGRCQTIQSPAPRPYDDTRLARFLEKYFPPPAGGPIPVLASDPPTGRPDFLLACRRLPGPPSHVIEPAPAEPNRLRGSPVKYAAAMAGLMAVSAWLAVADSMTRPADEYHVLPTALGDTRLFTTPDGTAPGDTPLSGRVIEKPVGHFNGTPLFLRARITTTLTRQQLERAGAMDIDGPTLYRPGPGSDRPLDPGHFFVLSADDPSDPSRGLFREVGPQKYGPGGDHRIPAQPQFKP